MKDVFVIVPDNELALIASSCKLGGNLAGRVPENLLKLRSSLVK